MESFKKIKRQILKTLQQVSRVNESVKLIAVSKKQPIEQIVKLWQVGQQDFGENYVQEWQAKAALLSEHPLAKTSAIRWHFIGHLQSNKAKEIVGKVEYIHSVDRIKLAKKISELAMAQGTTQKVLLQVNLGNEASKSGFLETELLDALPQLASLPNIQFVGLMAIPPAGEDPEDSRLYFKRLKSLLEECNQRNILKQTMTELSMGMSQDFTVAIEEGATMIRLGTLLFGPRK